LKHKLESEIGGNPNPKLGEVAPDFDSRFWGIEATAADPGDPSDFCMSQDLYAPVV